MSYAYYKRGRSYFVPSNATSLSGSINGYWIASPVGGPANCVFYIKYDGFQNFSRYYESNYLGASCGLCPVAILPSNIVEQNENGIWEAK